MKKYISVFTIMVMIFLAACSNQNTSSTPTSNENNTQLVWYKKSWCGIKKVDSLFSRIS